MYSCSACLPQNSEEELYDKILRLHVIANSDGDDDQKMKLFVRDALLCELQCLFEENEAENLEAAKAVVDNNRERLTECAQNAVFSYSPGCDYDVKLELTHEKYPTKKYEDIALPAGVYNSLKVEIGSASGKNWWCVLFPTLCLSTACADTSSKSYVYEEDGEEFIAAGFTPDEIRIITQSEDEDVKIKFRVLEIWGSLFG